jgi:hypothetical protein
LSRNEQIPEVVVAKSDWESFLSSIERLITLHKRTLQKLRKLRARNEALRTELRSAMELPTIKKRYGPSKEEKLVVVQPCRYCGYEIELTSRFCDHCGRPVAVARCECGRELGAADRFCDICGRPIAEP